MGIHGHPVQVSGGEQAGRGWGDDEKHIEVGHRGENRASHLYLWGAGEGREQWVNRAGNIWPALEHAGTVLQGRRNMWVMATSAMTSFSRDCLIIIIIIKSFAQDCLKSLKFRCAVLNICMIHLNKS